MGISTNNNAADAPPRPADAPEGPSIKPAPPVEVKPITEPVEESIGLSELLDEQEELAQRRQAELERLGRLAAHD